MRRSVRGLFVSVGVAGAVLLGATQASTAAAQARSAPVPAPAPAPDRAGGEVLDNTGSLEAAQKILCVFATRGDNVHVSSSAFEASGHGWWVNVNCRATLAVVTVQLQQYYTDGVWRNIGTVGRRTVRSGGGAGNRATGRAGCNTRDLTGWRSVVDVDVVGVIDDPRKLITPARNIPCRR